MTALKYLRPDIAFEPLICRWYAWSLLVAPATLAMTARNRLLPLMASFLEDPDFHRESVRDPALRGGSFVDFDGDLALAQAFDARVRRQLAPLLALADALVEANDLLLREGNGGSLEPLYERLPTLLRGCVELGYDLNNHPSLRLIEPLLYASGVCDPTLQSLLLRPLGEAERPFMLVTPVIAAPTGVLLETPFRDALVDDLARTREHGLGPAGFDALCSRLGAHCADPAAIQALFTDTPPAGLASPVPSGRVRVRYLGHASLLVEADGVAILVDPSLAYDTESGLARYTFADLPPVIDYVLITHNHQDHVNFETLLQLRYKIRTIVVPRCNGGSVQDPSLRLVLEQIGFGSVVELDELQSLAVPGGRVTGLPFLGEHCDLHIRTKLGYQVELQGQRVMFLADSNNLDTALYERLARLLPSPDVVFLGMECTGGPMSWLYGDLLPRRLRREHDQARRLNGSDFARGRPIVDLFEPRAVFVYAMCAEPWFSHLTSAIYTPASVPMVESDKLVAHCRRQGMLSERLYGTREIVLEDGRVTLG